MSFEPREYLRHILTEVEFVREQTGDLDYQAFVEDPVLQRAVVRSIEIIGEAVKNLPPEFTSAHPQVPWRQIAGMRDRLIHGYFAVDYALVWEVAESKLPELEMLVRELLHPE